MAILGIDFGTTNSVVAAYDRGSYPVVPHSLETSIGRVNHEVYPSFIHYNYESGHLSFGLEAERNYRSNPEGSGLCVRSLKRALGVFCEGLELDAKVRFQVKELLVQFLKSLKNSLDSSGFFPKGEIYDCVISWPAHANGAQRAVTREAFKLAGFNVIASLNEPTASAIEYADRVTGGNPRAARRLNDLIAVFDLGGGTFDASLLEIESGKFKVLDSIGLEDLGGDDFDMALCPMFLKKLKVEWETLDHAQKQFLKGHARSQKEVIGNQGAKSLLLDPEDLNLKGRPISVRTRDYLKLVQPLVDRAVDRLAELLDRSPAVQARKKRDLGAIYLVGGSSKLPLVQERIAKRFPETKVISTHKPFTSVAVGAAIYASQKLDVSDIFSRHFGVYRLLDEGKRDFFAPIFQAGTRLPSKGEPPLKRTLRYTPQHNFGHLKFLECTEVDQAGLPKGSIRKWSDVLFPYDPSVGMESTVDPDQIIVDADLSNTVVEEDYTCDHDGVITVVVNRKADGQARKFELYMD